MNPGRDNTVEFTVPADGVVELRLNRPDVHNAIDQSMIDDLDAALEQVRSSEARVMILTGNGSSFSAGHDLRTDRSREEGGISRPREAQARWTYEHQEFLDQTMRLFHLPLPTIAFVRGHCLAAGLSLAMACDLVYADPTARFGDPVLRMGALGAEAFLLPWLTGARQAKEMLFTGREVDADDALNIGLVNAVFPESEAERRVLDLAGSIAAVPRFAARMLKRSVNLALEQRGMNAWLEHHFDSHVLMHMTEEAASIMDSPERPARAKDFVRRREGGFA